jgi:hypothetical protein
MFSETSIVFPLDLVAQNTHRCGRYFSTQGRLLLSFVFAEPPIVYFCFQEFRSVFFPRYNSSRVLPSLVFSINEQIDSIGSDKLLGQGFCWVFSREGMRWIFQNWIVVVTTKTMLSEPDENRRDVLLLLRSNSAKEMQARMARF